MSISAFDLCSDWPSLFLQALAQEQLGALARAHPYPPAPRWMFLQHQCYELKKTEWPLLMAHLAAMGGLPVTPAQKWSHCYFWRSQVGHTTMVHQKGYVAILQPPAVQPLSHCLSVRHKLRHIRQCV